RCTPPAEMAEGSAPPIILWFRRDLRLADNPALAAAAKTGRAILPVFILDEGTGGRPIGGGGRGGLPWSPGALGAGATKRGTRLTLRRGAAGAVLDALIARTGATAVYWNRGYEPAVVARDTALKSTLAGRGIDVASFNAALLREPWTLRTAADQPFKI